MFARLFGRDRAPKGREGAVDLIDHPVFAAMSPRELADLPFPRPGRDG
ncbi:MAG: hypothetical protein ACOY5U_01005 [Pseudomonadota bacterium]